ncbi:MAG: ATP-binding protein [Pseudomonadota bacterium]
MRETFPDKAYVNLEAPDTRAHALEDPRGFLAQYRDGAILDEIQRTPDLPSYLQEMVDAEPTPGRFLLTGSQQFEVMGHISQSLAGRTALLKLLPLSLPELAAGGVDLSIDRHLLVGGYPRIHAMGLDPTQALGDYFETHVQRDLRQLMAIKDLALFENLAIVEALKSRLNRGKHPNLRFYRDAGGLEVDLLLEWGARQPRWK